MCLIKIIKHLKERIIKITLGKNTTMINKCKIYFYKTTGNICFCLSKRIGKVSNKLYNRYVRYHDIVSERYEQKNMF